MTGLRRWLVTGVLIALIAAACSGSDESDPESPTDGPVDPVVDAPADTRDRAPGGPEEPDLGDYAAVDPLDCNALLRRDEIDEALGVWDRPSGEQNSVGYSQGEYCSETIESDDRVFVSIEPGDPMDFEGGRLLGVRGQALDDPGDSARWFGGSNAEGNGTQGILSVTQDTSLGVLYFRIGLGRPDLSESEQIAVASTLASRALPRFPGMEAAAAAVPLVVLCELVTDEEADAVLAPYRDRHPATQDEVLVIGSAQEVDLRNSDEQTCQKLILAEIYLMVQQGSPDDFTAGAEKEGVPGEPVPGIGDEAMWFPGVPYQGRFTAPHEQAILGIMYRDAFLRIVLALPDTNEDELLGVATGLAQTALARLPGYVPPATDAGGEWLEVLDEEPPDRSGLSLVDNLLAKEVAGEWALGEGLVSTLQLLAGEASDEDVLRRGDAANREGTGIVDMAFDYLETGTDVSAKAEIERLLGLVLYSNAELELMAGIEPAGEAQAAPAHQVQIAFPRAQSTTDAKVTNCQQYLNPQRYGYTAGIGNCVEWRSADLSGDLKDKYRIFVPAPTLPQAGWTEDHYTLTLEALARSAEFYEGEGRRLVGTTGLLTFGKMPAVNVVFALGGGKNLAVANSDPGKPCGVIMYTGLQAAEKRLAGAIAFTVAHELAHCFIAENFPDQDKVPYRHRRWLEEGMAEYLAHVIYPAVNFEWESVPPNDDLSGKQSLLDQAYANVLFLQFLDEVVGKEQIFKLLASMPTRGARAEQEEAFAAFTGMEVLFHKFVERMIDGKIVDAGPTLVPFKMTYKTIQISRPVSATLDLKPFGIVRRQLVVSDCKIAHFEFDWRLAKDSARPASASSSAWAPFPTDLPAGSGDANDRVYTLASTRKTKVDVAVTELKDDPAPGCEKDDPKDSPPASLGCLTCGPSQYYRKKA